MDANDPVLSVVMPVRNGAPTIAAQLDALVACDDPGVPFEVVVADNGSTDDTVTIAKSYADRLPVRVVDASQATSSNYARNMGVRSARGSLVALCDSDDEVDRRWLTAVHEGLLGGHSLVAGPIDYTRLNPAAVRAWRGSDRAGIGPVMGFLPGAHGANMGFTRQLFDELGGFDDEFAYGGPDIEFVWRAQLAGHTLHDIPDAVVHYRLRPTLGALWKQSLSYGACEPHLYRKFGSEGMPRRSLGALARDLWWLVTRLPFAWPIGRRGAWLRRAGQQVGRFRGAVRYRIPWW